MCDFVVQHNSWSLEVLEDIISAGVLDKVAADLKKFSLNSNDCDYINDARSRARSSALSKTTYSRFFIDTYSAVVRRPKFTQKILSKFELDLYRTSNTIVVRDKLGNELLNVIIGDGFDEASEFRRFLGYLITMKTRLCAKPDKALLQQIDKLERLVDVEPRDTAIAYHTTYFARLYRSQKYVRHALLKKALSVGSGLPNTPQKFIPADNNVPWMVKDALRGHVLHPGGGHSKCLSVYAFDSAFVVDPVYNGTRGLRLTFAQALQAGLDIMEFDHIASDACAYSTYDNIYDTLQTAMDSEGTNNIQAQIMKEVKKRKFLGRVFLKIAIPAPGVFLPDILYDYKYKLVSKQRPSNLELIVEPTTEEGALEIDDLLKIASGWNEEGNIARHYCMDHNMFPFKDYNLDSNVIESMVQHPVELLWHPEGLQSFTQYDVFTERIMTHDELVEQDDDPEEVYVGRAISIDDPDASPPPLWSDDVEGLDY